MWGSKRRRTNAADLATLPESLSTPLGPIPYNAIAHGVSHLPSELRSTGPSQETPGFAYVHLARVASACAYRCRSERARIQVLTVSEVVQSRVGALNRIVALRLVPTPTRSDLLHRHEASHVRAASGGLQRPARVGKACESCAAHKVKCDDSRPCKRCRKREQECIDIHVDGQTEPQPQRTADIAPGAETDDCFDFGAQMPGALALPDALGVPPDSLQDLFDPQPDQFLPSFFENIMTDFAGPQSTELPPDISNMMPEQDDWLANLDLFGGDFAPNFESAMLHGDTFAERTSPIVSVAGAESTRSVARSHATACSNAFAQSPHVWVPESNQNAYSEHNSIQIDERMDATTSTPVSRLASSLKLGDRLSLTTRDEVFRTVIKTAKSRVLIKTFPSAERLDILLRIGIAKRMEVFCRCVD